MNSIPERPVRILVVDDEEQMRRAVGSILRARGYVLDFAASAHEALLTAIDHPPDLVVLDRCAAGSEWRRGLSRAALVDEHSHPRPLGPLR